MKASSGQLIREAIASATGTLKADERKRIISLLKAVARGYYLESKVVERRVILDAIKTIERNS